MTHPSLGSTIITLASFADEHGRLPQARELKNGNGTAHYTTMLREFGSWSGIVSSIVGYQTYGISTIATLFPPPPPRMLPCLGPGCANRIRWEGAHVRHCRTCRKRLFIAERRSTELAGGLPEEMKRDPGYILWRHGWDDPWRTLYQECDNSPEPPQGSSPGP